MLQTLATIGLAQAARLHTKKERITSDHVLTALKTQLIDDATCWPGLNRLFDSEAQALAGNPSGVFIDDDFHGQNALYSVNFVGDGGESSIAGPSDADLVASMNNSIDSWARATDIAEGDYSLWGSQGILPDGVNQGSLGDCWFLAAAAAIAEHGARIRKVFANRDYQANGYYVFELFVLGEPKWLVSDDTLPI
jgi:hypothetical protein